MRRFRRVSDGTRLKMSIAHQGRRNGMFGKHHSEETKRRISKSMKEYWSYIYREPDSLY